MMVHTTNPNARFVCAVCRQRVDELRFRTSRLAICADCVRLLNMTQLSAREAKAKWKADWQEVLRQERGQEVDGWKDSWFDNRLRQRLKDPKLLPRFDELKVLRAYQLRLVCLDRRYLGYPSNWSFKSLRTKSEDGLKCAICGAGEGAGEELHVHHIVFRSRSGTNSARNLVTLCFRHHQEQHDHPISQRGGEAQGPDIDAPVEDGDYSTVTETELDVDFEVDDVLRPVVRDFVSSGSDGPASRASDSALQLIGSQGPGLHSKAAVWDAPLPPTRSADVVVPSPVRIEVPVTVASVQPAPPLRGVYVPPVGVSRAEPQVVMRWVWVAAIAFGALVLLVSQSRSKPPETEAPLVAPESAALQPASPAQVRANRDLTEDEQAHADYAAEYARLVKRHPELLTDTRLAAEVADERDRLMAQGLSGHVALREAVATILSERRRSYRPLNP